MKNKSLILFIIVGFIVTVAIWGFVGGCGTSHISWGTRTQGLISEEPSAEGVILDKTSLPVEGQAPLGAKSLTGSAYIVEPGDTLWGISKRFGVSVAMIKEVNKLQTDIISVGQRLVIPGVQEPEVKEVKQEVSPSLPSSQKSEPKPGLVVYKVRKDDSLWRIAQIYGTTVERIADLNGLPKNAKLVPSQEILVPGDEHRPVR